MCDPMSLRDHEVRQNVTAASKVRPQILKLFVSVRVIVRAAKAKAKAENTSQHFFYSSQMNLFSRKNFNKELFFKSLFALIMFVFNEKKLTIVLITGLE